jgi:hypothetical protein
MIINKSSRQLFFVAVFLLCVTVVKICAQSSGGPFTITSQVAAGGGCVPNGSGGCTQGVAGGFSLIGTINEPGADNPLSLLSFSFGGGFWNLELVDYTPSVGNSTTNEDTKTTSGLVISRNPFDGGAVTHFKITNIQNGTLYKHDGITQINNGDFILVAEAANVGGFGLVFLPAPDVNSATPAAGSFDIQASLNDNNSGLGGSVITATITVTPVNDPPSFVKGPDQNVQSTAGGQTIPNWATDIRKGPVTATDETGQTLTFLVSNDNPGIFTSQPAISPTGTLTFTPLNGAQGTANVTVTLQDNGPNAPPNSNTSAPQVFIITVTSVDLTVSKTHVGNFKQADTGKTYTITVGNIGTSPSSGVVTLTDNLPAGLKATGWGGTGWNNCTAMPVTGPAVLTCDRSDALAAGNSFEPITLTVDVSCTAPSSVTNKATVSGGNDSTPGNNVSNDVTTVDPDNIKPVIVCPGGISKYTDSGQVTAKITVNPAVATDNCGTVTVTGVRSDGKALNAPFPVGVTVITWTAKDPANNTATCAQSVTVMVPSSPRRVPGEPQEEALLFFTDVLMSMLLAVW